MLGNGDRQRPVDSGCLTGFEPVILHVFPPEFIIVTTGKNHGRVGAACPTLNLHHYVEVQWLNEYRFSTLSKTS